MMNENGPLFFNLGSRDILQEVNQQKAYFDPPEKHAVQTNWRTLEDHSINSANILDIFANRIPVVRDRNFLSPEECEKILQVIQSHEKDHYDEEFTWPRLACIGHTLYDHVTDKDAYFGKAHGSYALQRRLKEELGIDLMQRVMDRVESASGIPVRLATEGDKEYFAGIIRAAQNGINVHADYAPYEAPNWSVQKIAAQATFNILLNPVPGGDTIIYDKQWVAPDDDVTWRKTFPKDTYHPQMLEGKTFKVMKAIPGDLTFFNPRNFHEVKACDTDRHRPEPAFRFTFSTFLGYMPGEKGEPDHLVFWA